MSKKPSTTTRTRKKEVTLDSNLGPIENLLSTLKIEIKHKNETQKKLTQSIKTNDVTICTGPAGTGKTYLAVAEAIRLLKSNLGYKKIVLIKSVTTLKGEEIGFLKGTLDEKMEPFIYSFISNFEKLIGKENTIKLRELKYVETLPISYLRGVSIDEAIILVDETQNITHDNMKTILTRLGENSKIIFLGDVEQIDLRNKKESSISNLIKKIKARPTIGIEIVEFNEDETVRHRLTSYFIKIFKDEPVKEQIPKQDFKKSTNWITKIISRFF